MKTIKKIGSGILSLVTLFFCNVSSVFPRSRLVGSIKNKLENSIYQKDNNVPEELILEQSDVAAGDHLAVDISHTSHRSHRSHSSHSSGSTGRTRTTAPRETTPPPSTSKPKTTPVAPFYGTGVVISPYAMCLTVSDFESLSGLSGIIQEQEQAALHFFRADRREILRVRFEDSGYIQVFQGDLFPPIQGVGESAIMGVLPMPSFVVFKKGTKCVEITSYQDEGSSLFLSIGQLISIAKHIASRL